MAGTEHRGPGPAERRRFITRAHVEDAAAAGTPIRVSGRDTVTDEAAQRAADLGVAIERDGGGARGDGHHAGPTPARPLAGAPRAVAASQDELRSAVRAAVIAELGSEVPGLDAVIDRVLKSRSL